MTDENMDLDSMKYAELQKLAKELGLKANMKADKLLKAIKQHYKEEKGQHQKNNNEVKAATPDPPKTVKEGFPAATFVNTRRGKGAGAKRKMSDAAGTESDEVPPEESVAPSESAKRRRVSAKTEKTEAQATKEPQAERKGGKIPRLQKKVPMKPVTPNFKKLHEAQFNKMESIDSYVQRKTKQMETYKNAVQELKILSDQTKQQIKGKSETLSFKCKLKKPKQTRTSLFSPAPASKAQVEERRRHTLLSASRTKSGPKKSVRKEEAIFKPTVLSTRRINVRFSEATKDNEHKKSLIKTPARMSPCVASSTPQEKPGVMANVVKITSLSVNKTPGPFVFTGNTSASVTPGTQKKNAFDLKASLARPLSYKPHTGKLKPFGDTKENPAANKSMNSHQNVTVNSHQKNYKQHQVQTRDDRRAKHNEDRKQKKNNLLGARRGLVMM